MTRRHRCDIKPTSVVQCFKFTPGRPETAQYTRICVPMRHTAMVCTRIRQASGQGIRYYLLLLFSPNERYNRELNNHNIGVMIVWSSVVFFFFSRQTRSSSVSRFFERCRSSSPQTRGCRARAFQTHLLNAL